MKERSNASGRRTKCSGTLSTASEEPCPSVSRPLATSDIDSSLLSQQLKWYAKGLTHEREYLLAYTELLLEAIKDARLLQHSFQLVGCFCHDAAAKEADSCLIHGEER